MPTLAMPTLAMLATPLDRLDGAQRDRLAALPRSLMILLENVLAHEADAWAHVAACESWLQHGEADHELPFRPTRILMQDTAGVAALADLAALRDHAAAHGHDPALIDAAIPIDLVIDHSLRVDHSGTADAAERNIAAEYARNGERYAFFKWAEKAFDRLRVVPPGQGICHQINLERLTHGVVAHSDGTWMAETVIGTDSHTTMVNALGVLGWGVGGIEAELAALGSAIPIALPHVCEVRLTGRPPAGSTATDLALAIAARLRAEGVVDVIVEFDGEALDHLSLPDRAAIANMCPEYGATAALFPVDPLTLAYLAEMGRDSETIAAYRGWAMATGAWRDAGPARHYSRSITISLATMGAIMAGPSRPDQVHPLNDVAQSLAHAFPTHTAPADRLTCGNGAIAIAAITSCTNTANPALMVAAGLLARNAVARGLRVPDWVKTSLAPGSRRIADLLRASGLQQSLDALGFQVVGFGCTTCVGNSGELKPETLGTDLLVALLSGNRNFENRIHPMIRANYLASPPLVVAGALAGNLFVDLARDPVGFTPDGTPVHLHELWPSATAIAEALAHGGGASDGDDLTRWHQLSAPKSRCFEWDRRSTFIVAPPFFDGAVTGATGDVMGARPLLVLGDGITTDHISPIGRIMPGSPAGDWLSQAGVSASKFGNYGERRANHHAMVRGTFDNARLRNRLVDQPGNWTLDPDGAERSVFEAARRFAERAIPTVIFAGQAYGTGSARDWAAKGTALLGVRAVIARSFERIHRTNLIALGVVPVLWDEDAVSLIGPDTTVSIHGIADLAMRATDLEIRITAPGSAPRHFPGRADIRSDSQAALLRHGGLFADLRQRFA